MTDLIEKVEQRMIYIPPFYKGENLGRLPSWPGRGALSSFIPFSYVSGVTPTLGVVGLNEHHARGAIERWKNVPAGEPNPMVCLHLDSKYHDVRHFQAVF